MANILYNKISQHIDNKGVSEEKQLLSRWRKELAAFLRAFEEELLNGHVMLEIGLETQLALKLIVKSYEFSPIKGLLKLLPSLSPLQQKAARMALDHRYRFHMGLRLEIDACHREIYIYDTANRATELLQREGIPPLPQGIVPTAYGLDEKTGISAYFTRFENPSVENMIPEVVRRLSAELKYDVASVFNDLWDHLRLKGDTWVPAKFAVEMRPASLELLLRVMSHYKPPYFRYLVRRSPHRSIIITSGRGAESVQGWYFTI